MDNALQIFSEKSRYGVKDEKGKIIIAPEYMEMQPFSCGVSLVRNFKHQYAYINRWNQPIIPFGKYTWCDPQFVCGYARVIEYQAIQKSEKFGIIDTLGNIIVPIKYDQIWVLNELYFSKIKAFIGDKLEFINLFELTKHTILDGLKYIQTYSVADFKRLVHCSVLSVRRNPLTNHLYFVYGCNFGLVATHGIPKDPVVSIVANSQGKIFPLLTEKKDVGVSTFAESDSLSTKKEISNQEPQGYQEYDEDDDRNDWSDPYGDEQDYYVGWSREEVDSGLADAYEGDRDAYLNNN